MTSHYCALFVAFTNVSAPFAGSKYDLYCPYLLAISRTLSIFSKSVDMIPPRFCCFLLLPNWHHPLAPLPFDWWDNMGQIFGYLVSKTYPRLYLNRLCKGSLILLNLFLDKFSKYFDTWDWGLIGEANLFTPLSSEATGILDIGHEWRNQTMTTDIIFVNFFTPAQFQDFKNLPEKSA